MIKPRITVNIVGSAMSQLVYDAGVIKAQMAAAGYEYASQHVEHVDAIKRYSATQFYSRRVYNVAQG